MVRLSRRVHSNIARLLPAPNCTGRRSVRTLCIESVCTHALVLDDSGQDHASKHLHELYEKVKSFFGAAGR